MVTWASKASLTSHRPAIVCRGSYKTFLFDESQIRGSMAVRSISIYFDWRLLTVSGLVPGCLVPGIALGYTLIGLLRIPEARGEATRHKTLEMTTT